MVMSRAFTFKNHDSDGIAMVPFCDMANHFMETLGANTNWNFNYNLQQYEFRATKDIKKGEEIGITYNYEGNSEFLAKYSFVLENNTDGIYFYDDVQVRINITSERDPAYENYSHRLLVVNSQIQEGDSLAMLHYLRYMFDTTVERLTDEDHDFKENVIYPTRLGNVYSDNLTTFMGLIT